MLTFFFSSLMMPSGAAGGTGPILLTPCLGHRALALAGVVDEVDEEIAVGVADELEEEVVAGVVDDELEQEVVAGMIAAPLPPPGGLGVSISTLGRWGSGGCRSLCDGLFIASLRGPRTSSS